MIQIVPLLLNVPLCRFWRTEYTKNMDVHQFEEKFNHEIRYMYGEEVPFINWKSHSCWKIIVTEETGDEIIGCPFKTFKFKDLQKLLKLISSDEKKIEEINLLCLNGHYQIACSRYFNLVHNSTSNLCIRSPNQYFKLSKDFAEKLHLEEKKRFSDDKNDSILYDTLLHTEKKLKSITDVTNWKNGTYDDEINGILNQIPI